MPHADKEARRQYREEYRAARRAELAAKQRDYYQRNRAANDARNVAWLEANPETARLIRSANSMNSRARKWGQPGKLDVADLRAVTGPCAYCGAAQETWDHVIPLSGGGANSRSNLVPCCESCNRSKGSRLPTQQTLL